MSNAPVIVSVGSINVDFQLRVGERPAPGQTLVGSDFVMLGGGKAANVAYLARKLGSGALLVARVGDDELAERALAPLAEIGVDLGGAQRGHGETTGVAMIAVPPDGRKIILMAPNANDRWNRSEAAAAAEAVMGAPAGSMVVLDLEVSEEVVRGVVDASTRRDLRLMVDPSPASRFADDLFDAVDFILPNASETEELTGRAVRSMEDAFRAAQDLVDRGVGTAVVRLPDGNAAIVGNGVRERIRSFEAPTFDATGAGDAFVGAFAVALLNGQSAREAGRLGAAASAIAVTRYGSQPAYPRRDELDAFLRREP